jgi:hypothetical protein
MDIKAKLDPQGAIIFLFAGIYLLPVMGFFWVSAKHHYYKVGTGYDRPKT